MTPDRRQRLYLHVGLPKSGTTHLQDLLARSRSELRAAGFVYPFVRPEAMFHAAVELRDQHDLWGLPPQQIDGTWAQLLERLRSMPAMTGIISHEILAGASPAVIDRVTADTDDFELHVVVTVRDLARQVVAHWQEEVKNGRSWSFAELEDTLFTPGESIDAETGFWRSQDLLDVVSRWGAGLPPERLHVVTVPPAGTPPSVLTRRFEEALDLPIGLLSAQPQPGANRSLGTTQVRVLRSVVSALDGRLAQPAYAHVVKRWFAQQVLAGTEGPAPKAPAELVAVLEPITRGWVEELDAAGHPVVGELVDLVPVPDGAAAHPDEVSGSDVADLTPALLAEALLEIARLRDQAQPDTVAAPPAAPRRRGIAQRWLGSRRAPLT